VCLMSEHLIEFICVCVSILLAVLAVVVGLDSEVSASLCGTAVRTWDVDSRSSWGTITGMLSGTT
jgi:hypothetical protein